MCKVIQFQFNCGHYLKLRESKCRGTYHKERRSGKTAACIAEAYIVIKLSFDCGQCQQNAWETSWKQKLERAKIFQTNHSENGLPGVEKISELVENLEHEYNRLSWDLRMVFPPLHKKSIEKVKLGWKHRQTSPLTQEVRPEDVILGTELEEAGLDDVEASTDPFHPITADCSRHLDDADNSWVDAYLSQQETELPEFSDTGFKFKFHNWDSSHEPDTHNTWDLTAWGPDAEAASSTGIIDMNGLKPNEELHRSQIEQVEQVFWEVVQGNAPPQQSHHPSSSSDTSLNSPLEHLAISDSTPHTTSPPSNYIWTDGASSPPPIPPQEGEIPVPPPRRFSRFDKMRTGLEKYKVSNPDRYYAKWLEVCRMEIRTTERGNGRFIPFPPKSQDIWKEESGG